MITIDGSIGEGGGQILRTSLSLSLCTGQPFRMEKIRAGRKKPGLLRQHLTAVLAATQISDASVSGAEIGSSELTFAPKGVKGGDYRFAVGTAGSATLVFQTVLPALLAADEPSTLTCEGGTHNPFAPPFDFLQICFLPIINRMGPQVSVELQRYGFYPAGGGRFVASITPTKRLIPFELLNKGEVRKRWARAVLADLPGYIGEKELDVVRDKLDWPPGNIVLDRAPEGSGPGNVLLIGEESEFSSEIAVGFGEKGVTSEKVAHKAVDQIRRYLASKAAVGEYLADQLLLPCALAGGGRFSTVSLTKHMRTNVAVIEKFINCRFNFQTLPESGFVVECNLR